MKLLSRLAIIAITLCLPLVTVSCTCAVGGATVSLIPSLEEGRPGEHFEVGVQIEPGDQGVSAVEINLAFEPQAIQVVDVRPGALLGERPLPGMLEIDNEVGSLNYSLARVGETIAPTPDAVFAVIMFQILEPANPGNYELDLINIGLADENFNDTKGIQLKDASIRVRP